MDHIFVFPCVVWITPCNLAHLVQLVHPHVDLLEHVVYGTRDDASVHVVVQVPRHRECLACSCLLSTVHDRVHSMSALACVWEGVVERWVGG